MSKIWFLLWKIYSERKKYSRYKTTLTFIIGPFTGGLYAQITIDQGDIIRKEDNIPRKSDTKEKTENKINFSHG